MKVWFGYGSEHSMNLVLIGRFDSPASVEAAVEMMERLRTIAEAEWSDDSWRHTDEWMTDSLRQALSGLKLHEMGRWDVDNFAYDYSTGTSGSELRIATDESEIQGFLKVLLHLGARVEIYSLHEWNEDGTPRTPHEETASPSVE